ncbi:MAG TPA: flagellar biosynthesis protein FlhB [Tepiditoga sp.]|nr:flagellar biosynthesis protein FlhB [Tepiditoga sp.]
MDTEYDRDNLKYSLKINIQLFADPDKTEEPTQRKIDKAREEGNVAQSRDFLMAISFLTVAALILLFIKPLAVDIANAFYDYFDLNLDWIESNIMLRGLILHSNIYIKVMLFFAGAFFISLITGFIQTKFLIAPKSLKFDLKKLDPISGFKKLFSVKSLVELLKNILKIFIVGYFGYSIISNQMDVIPTLADKEIMDSLSFILSLVTEIMFKMGIALLVLSFVDYFYQKYDYRKNLRMTKKEVKDEMKDVEGNPEVKRKQKEFMMKVVFSRMIQQVPSADVVVTNPTHYAVAIKYDAKEMAAPKVVAKGADEIAKNIKKVARNSFVPIIEKPSLARELYARVEINKEIPDDLYKTVAEVLAYVYKTADKKNQGV